MLKYVILSYQERIPGGVGVHNRPDGGTRVLLRGISLVVLDFKYLQTVYCIRH